MVARQRKPLRGSVFALLTCCAFLAGLPSVAVADSSPYRISVLGAVGTAAVSVSGLTRVEAPLQYQINLERRFDAHLTLGVEYTHAINLSPFSMGIFFVGGTARYYFGMGVPTAAPDSDEVRSTWFARHLAPFLGLGTGVGMADITREEGNGLIYRTTGTGVYLSAKTGLEYPLFHHLGARAEATFLFQFIGTSMISLGAGAGVYYWF